MTRRSGFWAFPMALAALTATLSTRSAGAKRELADYRYFRALSVDLQGRIPTDDELTAFERDGFEVDQWIDQRLQGPAYSERVRRIYMDLLRLQVNRTFRFVPQPVILHREELLGPDGETIYVYFKQGQRREREATDGTFCMTKDETGLVFAGNGRPQGKAKPISQETLDQYTTVVKPWWLYGDFKSATPSDRYDAAKWAVRYPNFEPIRKLLVEKDGSPSMEVRVCREEASTSAKGTVFAPGRGTPKGETPPYDRIVRLPSDSAFAKEHAGEKVTCASASSIQITTDCGCGPALERCMPGASPGNDSPAFVLPNDTSLGIESPLGSSGRQQSEWSRLWWSEEAVRYLDTLVGEDRDFREVLTGRWTMVNGPLTHFYRWLAPGTCCGGGAQLGYVHPEGLVDAANLPKDLAPFETATWRRVDDRGPHAAGILTMPIFLAKFGSRRGRAHAIYNAFLCKEFTATNVPLSPSTEQNLMLRPGCNTCHVALEPLAAYFTRIVENDWTFLPQREFPLLQKGVCANADPKKAPAYCRAYYDPAFTSATQATLRGAYASAENAEAGPVGAAKVITGSSEFSSCVVQNVASSFLGRGLSPDDAVLQRQLADTFTGSGFKMTSLVRALVHADAYRRANNLAGLDRRDATAEKGGAR